jgi:uncharacterized protein YjbI with pentapeptide repeats
VNETKKNKNANNKLEAKKLRSHTERVSEELRETRQLLGRPGNEISDRATAARIVSNPLRKFLFAGNHCLINALEPIKYCAFLGIINQLKPALEVIGVLLIPVVLYWASQSFEQQRQAQEVERLQQETVQNYYAQISGTLLQIEGDLQDEDNQSIRTIAAATTITLLRDPNLNGERKGQVVGFLSQMNLIQSSSLEDGEEQTESVLTNLGEVYLNNEEAEPAMISLSKTNLSEANLSKVNLIGADLIEANLSRANLSEANLSNANLRRANLSEANLSKINLSGTDLSGFDLSRFDLNGANLKGVNLSDADLERTDLVKTNLNWAKFHNANLNQAKLIEAHLNWAILNRAKLRKTELNTADLKLANLIGTNLPWANLSGADLDWACLVGANLAEADLSGADLNWANFIGANLARADLSGGRFDLSGFDLSGSWFTSFGGSRFNLSGANLSGTIFLGRDLRNTLGITVEQLTGKNAPLICNSPLPDDVDIAVSQDRDCAVVAQALFERYPERFETLGAAQKYVNEQRQKTWD